MYKQDESFRTITRALSKRLKEEGQLIDTQWQARDTVGMLEIFNAHFSLDIPQTIQGLQALIQPDLPWSEEHFSERVSGKMLNPAPSYIRWPYYKDDEKWKIDEKFSHTYPERMNVYPYDGIRYQYGNLYDVVALLKDKPDTRQAYLPIWFPEDTGAVHGERVPCSLGYQFYIRNGYLDCYYSMRSCDFRRHFKNDVYMAGRLMQWVAGHTDVSVGQLHMHVMNLHIFKGEEVML